MNSGRLSGIATARRTVYDGIVDEFLHNHRGGARLLAVAGADAAGSAAFADDLAHAFTEHGVAAASVLQEGRGEEALRAEVVSPLRAAGADAVTIVAGDASLLAGRTRWLWHSSVWLAAGDELVETEADVIVDVVDPQHPSRRFADFCQCDVG